MGIKKEFGQKIKRMRIRKGLTQEQLAEMIDVSQRTLSGIETGESFVTSDTFDKLVSALNTTAEELFYVDHLCEPAILYDKVLKEIKTLETEPKKLEFLYRFVQILANE